MSLARNPRLFKLLNLSCSPLKQKPFKVTSNISLFLEKTCNLTNFARSFSAGILQAQQLVDTNGEGADNIFREIERIQRRFGYVKRDQVNKMMDAAHRANTITPGQSLFLLRCCGSLTNMEKLDWRRRTTTKVMDLFTKLDMPLDISHYNMLLRVHLDNETKLDPQEFLDGLSQKGVEPNRVTYSRLIEYYCKDGNIEGSNKMLEVMREKNYALNEDIFNSLIIGNARTGDLQGALSIVDTMKQAGLSPGTQTYASVMQAYVENSDMDGFYKYVQENEEFLNSAKAYVDLIPIIIKNGLQEHIPKIIERYSRLDRFTIAVNAMVVKLTNEQNFDVAMQLVKSAPKGYATKFNYLLENFVDSDKDLEKLMEVCNDFRESDSDSFPHECVLRKLLINGNREKALSFLRAMSEASVPIRSNYLFPFLTVGSNHYPYETVNTLKEFMALKLPLSLHLINYYVLPNMSPAGIDDVCDLFDSLKEYSAENVDVTFNNLFLGFVDYLLRHRRYRDLANFLSRFKHGITLRAHRRRLVLQMLMEANPRISVIALKQFLPFSLRVHTAKEEGEHMPSKDTEMGFDAIGIILEDFLKALTGKVDLETKFMDLLESMQYHRISIGTNYEKITELLGSHCTDQMRSILLELSNPELKATLSGYGDGSVKHSEQKMKELEDKGEEVPIALMASIVSGYSRMGVVEKAEPILVKLKVRNATLNPQVRMHVGKMYLRNDRLEEAEEIFKGLAEEVEQGFILPPYVVLKLVEEVILADRVEDAIKYALLLSPPNGEWGLVAKGNTGLTVVCLDSVKKALAEKADINGVQRLQEVLDSRNYMQPEHTMGLLVEYHIHRGELAEALKEYQTIADERNITVSQRKLCLALIEADDIDNLQKVVNTSSRLYGEMNTLYDLMFLFLQCGKVTEAEKIMKTTGIKTLHNKLRNHCQWLLSTGKISVLEDLVRVTKDLLGLDRQQMYMFLLDANIRNNDPQKAVNVWMSMQEEGISCSDEFLWKLSSFLKTKGIKPPFKTPEISGEDFEREKEFSAGAPLEANRTAPLTRYEIEAKLTGDSRNSFIEEVKSDYVRGAAPANRFALPFFDHLTAQGDVENLLSFEQFLGPEEKSRMRWRNKIGMAHINSERLGDYMKILEEEGMGSGKDMLASGIILNIMKRPMHFDALLSLAEKRALNSDKTIYAVLFDYYFGNNEKEKAMDVYEKHLKDEQLFSVDHTKTQCSLNKDIPTLCELKDILKQKGAGHESGLTKLETTHAEILLSEDKVEEAIDVIRQSLNYLKLQDYKRDQLSYLHRKVVAKGGIFPFIPSTV